MRQKCSTRLRTHHHDYNPELGDMTSMFTGPVFDAPYAAICANSCAATTNRDHFFVSPLGSLASSRYPRDPSMKSKLSQSFVVIAVDGGATL